MKKLTKLTALALALALLLGMTAFAGTPSEILVYDDFSDFKDAAGNVAFTNFDTTARVKNTIEIKGNSENAFFSPTDGIYKYFYDNNMTLVNTNGKVTIAENSRMDNASPTGGFYYTVPGGWTYDKYGDNSYALVAQMDWTPVSAAAGKYLWGHQGNIGVVIDTANATNEINKYLAFSVNSDGTAVTTLTANQGSENNGRSNESAVPVGGETVIRQIVRAYPAHSSSGDSENTFDSDTSLNVFSHLSRGGNTLNGNYLHGTSNDDITELKGFWFASGRYVQSTWGEFVMYKLSLDRNDFYMETEAIAETVANDGSVDIVFSQPLSTTHQNYSSYGNTDMLPNVLVQTGEGDDVVTLTYGEDYTISVDEKIVETAIKGVMTIKPLNEWAFGTTYTVTMPTNVVSAARIAMLPENIKVVTFTTEAAPTFDVELKAYAGLSDTGSELSALEAGTTYFAVTANYKEGKVVSNGTIRLEILDADGNVVKYVTNKKDLTSTATFGAAFKVEAGYKARVSIDGGVIGEATID